MKKEIVIALSAIVGQQRISQQSEDLNRHAKDKSFHDPSLPDIIVWPKHTKEVSKIMKVAYTFGVPVTAWGAGTSLMGNSIPVRGGIVLNMILMNKILEVIPDSFQVRVQPGVICDDLNDSLKKDHMFLPAFPGSSHIATLGGVIANNAGGMFAVKYGVMADWVMELEVVLASGKIVHLGSRSIKSVSGYNLLDLFIGSSGTLGIITEATLKLLPIPDTKMAILVSFSTLKDVGEAIMGILNSGIKPAAMEHMDELYVAMVNQAQKDIKLAELDTLLIELHGNKDVLAIEIKVLEKICKRFACATYQEFITPEDCDRLWGCRKGVRLAFYKMSPNTGILSAEVGVPISYIPDFIYKVKELQKQFGVKMLNHGHVGDGNFHAWALYDLTDPASLKQAEKVNDYLVRYAISVGGTATGEHGLGIGKREFLQLEHPSGIEVMLDIKRLLDPKGILNPGKIFPENV